MNWKEMFQRNKNQVRPIQQPRPIKKDGCKIKFKKTSDGEIVEFSPSCKPEQIEAAKQMREENRENA